MLCKTDNGINNHTCSAIPSLTTATVSQRTQQRKQQALKHGDAA